MVRRCHYHIGHTICSGYIQLHDIINRGCGTVNATGTITVGALADAGSLSGSSNTLGTGQTVQLSSSGTAGELGRPMMQV